MMTKEKEDLELEDFEVDHFKSFFQQPKQNSHQAMSRKKIIISWKIIQNVDISFILCRTDYFGRKMTQFGLKMV